MINTSISSEEASARISDALKAAGIMALITIGRGDARISATFPDGAKALFQELEIDTEKQ